MGILNKLFNKKKKGKEVKENNMAKKKGDVLVKVGRTGAKVVEIALNGDRSVSAALREAGFAKKEAEIVNVNGEEVDDMNMELEDGDRVILVKNIQGGKK